MNDRRFARAGALGLAGLLAYGILTLWVTGRWALGFYQAAALVAAAVCGIRLAARPADFRWTTLLAPLSFIPLWGLIQLADGKTVYRWETWNSVLNWTVNFALFWLAFQVCTRRHRREGLVTLLFSFAAALSVISTVQMFTSGGKVFWLFPTGYTDFVLGPFVYKNQYAAFIETVLPLALYRGMTRKNPLAYWIIAGAMVASVMASASRAGTVLVLAEVLVIPLLAAVRDGFDLRRAGFAIGSGIALSAVFTAVVGWDVIWSRLNEADPYTVRREMLRSSIRMVHDRPAIGFGLGTWSTAYPAYALYDDGLFANQAHNDWAQWAVEGGLPLAVALLIFAVLLGRLAWNCVWGFGLISVLLHSLVDYPLQQRPALAGWFFALAGALAAAGVAKQMSSRCEPAS